MKKIFSAGLLLSTISLNLACAPESEAQAKSKLSSKYAAVAFVDPLYFGVMTKDKFESLMSLKTMIEAGVDSKKQACDQLSLPKDPGSSDIPSFLEDKLPSDELANLHKVDLVAMKRLFVCYTLPNIVYSNLEIIEERFYFFQNFINRSAPEAKEAIVNLADALGVDSQGLSKDPDSFLKEIGIKLLPIPVSLALAQASEESGWGHVSKFTRNCNNIYSVYYFGDAVTPDKCIASKAKNRKLKNYVSILASTRDYMFLLNSSKYYKDLRLQRYKDLKAGKLGGKSLTGKLGKYAENPSYAKHLRAHIRRNDFAKWDVIFQPSGDLRQILQPVSTYSDR